MNITVAELRAMKWWVCTVHENCLHPGNQISCEKYRPDPRKLQKYKAYLARVGMSLDEIALDYDMDGDEVGKLKKKTRKQGIKSIWKEACNL